DEAVPVALLDLLPRLPAENGRALEENDLLHRGIDAGVEIGAGPAPELIEGVGARECFLGDVFGDLVLELLEDGAEQVVLGREVVVERPACDSRSLDDLGRRRGRVAALGEQLPRGRAQRGPRRIGLLGFAGRHPKMLTLSSSPRGEGSARPVATSRNCCGSPLIFSPPPPTSITYTPSRASVAGPQT